MTLESELFLMFSNGEHAFGEMKGLVQDCVHDDILPPQCSWLPQVAGKCQQIRVSGTFSSWR